MAGLPGPKHVAQLGSYIREQRENAQYSLRQLAQAAGVSNPYLSQIERGLRKPSAEILQQLAKALKISAETLYIQAGLLDERLTGDHRTGEGEDEAAPERPSGADFVAPNGVIRAAAGAVVAAINADRDLTQRQKQILLEIYESFRAASRDGAQDVPNASQAALRASRADENSRTTDQEGGRK